MFQLIQYILLIDLIGTVLSGTVHTVQFERPLYYNDPISLRFQIIDAAKPLGLWNYLTNF